MKILCIVIILIFSFEKSFAQREKIIEGFRKEVEFIAKRNGSVYILDSSLLKFPFTYSILLNNLEGADSSLLKKILEFGKVEVIDENLKNEIIQKRFNKLPLTDFSKLKTTKLELSEAEARTLKTIDSIENLKQKLFEDSVAYYQLNLREKALMNTEAYNSYFDKLRKADKRLLFFYPVYIYQNNILIVIGSFKAISDSYLIVKIL
jgi:hypothetical protein